eukprot:GHVP01068985.1.p1 GENE.GHVP01068985.1~~GHVP01068985.1.p1  ORF type:complete len:251 (-),score=39.25 GHVP01068985.1:407-1159(-)
MLRHKDIKIFFVIFGLPQNLQNKQAMEPKVFAVVAILIKPMDEEPSVYFDDVDCRAKRSQSMGGASMLKTLISKQSVKHVAAKTKNQNDFLWGKVTAAVILISILSFCGKNFGQQFAFPNDKLSAEPFLSEEAFPNEKQLDQSSFNLREKIEINLKNGSSMEKYSKDSIQFQYRTTYFSLQDIIKQKVTTRFVIDGICFFAEFCESLKKWTVSISIPVEYCQHRIQIKGINCSIHNLFIFFRFYPKDLSK